MLGSIVAFAAVLFGLAGIWLLVRFLPKPFLRSNFQGRTIPTALGIAYVLAAEVYYLFQWLAPNSAHCRSASLCLLVSTGFGVLGLIDDLLGDRSAGGFRGHFQQLLREGKATTGVIKAIGGGVLSLIAAWLLHGTAWLPMLMTALVIALSANALNLLDTRPGRCLAGFFAGAIVLTAVLVIDGHLRGGVLFIVPLVVAALLFVPDSRGWAMLGDTGANSLGATLGLAAALLLPMPYLIADLVFLIGFHVWTENHSLSRMIEDKPLLRRLDRKIGVR